MGDSIFVPTQLQQVADDLKDGHRRNAHVRTLLSWFNAYRRRKNVVENIRAALNELGLVTLPDFEEQFFDQRVVFQAADNCEETSGTNEADPAAADPAITGVELDPSTPEQEPADFSQSPFDENSEIEDVGEPVTLRIIDEPTYQVSHLPTASKAVVSVSPNTNLVAATTEMLYRDFDQLPVMTGPREVKGVINWKSIGRAKASGKQVTTVADGMQPAHEIALHESIFEAVRIIQQHECVLVRDRSKQVCGIVTSFDISRTFNDLAEPFLLIGEIENLTRNMIAANFSLADIKTVQREGDKEIATFPI